MNCIRMLLSALLLSLAFVSAAAAKTVYLKDGGTVACEAVWRRGDLVIVKVNRELHVELGAAEVDLGRTFRSHKKKRLQHRTAKPATVATPVVATAPTKVLPPTPKEVKTPPPPAAAKPTPVPVAAKPAPPPPAPPAAAPSAQPAAVREATTQQGSMPAPDPAAVKRLAEMQAAATANAAPAAAASSLILLFGCGALLIVILVVANYRIFTKAGEAGWKSLIPIYNLYVLIKIAGKPGWWLILLFIPLAGVVIYLLTMIALAERFGKGLLFGLGLFFLGFIFFPVLAFDGSQYESVSW